MSLVTKIVGGAVFAVGLLIVILFPSMRDYQPERFALTGILFGVALMGIGIYLVML